MNTVDEKTCKTCLHKATSLFERVTDRCVVCLDNHFKNIGFSEWETDPAPLLNRIAELELELQRYKQAPNLPHISGGSCKTTHYACDCVLKRIAELEAQLPKVVKPHIEIVDCGTDTVDLDFCDCGSEVAWHEDYCPDCGAKLDWSSND